MFVFFLIEKVIYGNLKIKIYVVILQDNIQGLHKMVSSTEDNRIQKQYSTHTENIVNTDNDDQLQCSERVIDVNGNVYEDEQKQVSSSKSMKDKMYDKQLKPSEQLEQQAVKGKYMQ